MAITLLSNPTPHQSLFSQRLYTNRYSCSHGSVALVRYPSKSILPLASSSSSSSTSIVEDNPPPTSPDAPYVQSDSPIIDADQLPDGGCKACGRQEIEKGCNGEGRIQGGIATVPGFGWWPIKAYRPCPRFVASGGRYRRQGQSMDEVAFGRGEKESTTEVEYSKKRQDRRRFKKET